MRTLTIEHFGGVEIATDEHALIGVLGMRFGQGVNEFWISGVSKFPLLSVLVHGSLAHLIYFPAKGHPGFVSISAEEGHFGDDSVMFYTNTPEEELPIDRELVVPLQTAIDAVMEFSRSEAKPTGLSWSEL